MAFNDPDGDFFVVPAPAPPQPVPQVSANNQICKYCDEDILPGQPLFRGLRNQHHACGLAWESLRGALDSRPEVKQQFQALTPAEQASAFQPMIAEAGGHTVGNRRVQQIEAAINIITHKYRIREIRSRKSSKLLDRDQFIAHQRYTNGKSKSTAVSMWNALGRANKLITVHGKPKTWVRMLLTVMGDDVVGGRIEEDPRVTPMNRNDATNLFRNGLQATSAASAIMDVPGGLHLDSVDDVEDAIAPPADDQPDALESDEDDDEESGMGVDGDSDALPPPPSRSSRQRGSARRAASSSRPQVQLSARDGGNRRSLTAAASAQPPSVTPKPSRKRGAETSPEAALTLSDLPAKAAKPLELARCKMVFRQAIADRCSGCKVDNTDKPTEMEQCLAKYKDHPDVSCLDVKDVASDARKAYSALQDFSTAIQHWKVPLDVEAKKTFLTTMMDAYVEKMDTVAAYKEMAGTIDITLHKQSQAARRRARYDVEALAGKFNKTAGAPRGVARAIAGIVDQFLKNPEDMTTVTYSAGYAFEVSRGEQSTRKDVFNLPRCLSKDGAHKTHWHNELDKVFNAHQGDLVAKMPKYIAQCTEAKCQHGNSTLQLASAFQWNSDSKSDGPFQVEEDVRSLYIILQCQAFVSPRSVLPLLGAGLFITVVSGTVAALIVQEAPLPENVDLVSYLSSATYPTLQKVPTCILSTGDSLWVPFGSSPVLMGIAESILNPPPTKQKGGKPTESAVEWASVMCHVALDSQDAAQPKEVCGAVAGDLTKWSSLVPASISQHNAYKAWKSKLEASACAAGANAPPLPSGAPASEAAAASGQDAANVQEG